MTVRAWQLLSASLAGAVVALAAMLLVLNGLPAAAPVQAHNGTAGQVHSCVNTSTGAVRFTNATTSASGSGLDRACAANETATDWSVGAISGPIGPSGPSGPAGPATAAASTIGGGTGDGTIPSGGDRELMPYNTSTSFVAGGAQRMPVGGTISKLSGNGVGIAFPIVFTLRKNGVNTAVTCTILGALSCTDSVNSASFAEGDQVTVLVHNGVNSAQAVSWIAKFVPAP